MTLSFENYFSFLFYKVIVDFYYVIQPFWLLLQNIMLLLSLLPTPVGCYFKTLLHFPNPVIMLLQNIMLLFFLS